LKILKNSKVYKYCLLNLVVEIVKKEHITDDQKDSIISKIDLLKKSEPIIELES
tara:strand:- start:845 stop:1006 length:162 start_codon:yes stop_codon:yes gene_type:complete